MPVYFKSWCKAMSDTTDLKLFQPRRTCSNPVQVQGYNRGTTKYFPLKPVQHVNRSLVWFFYPCFQEFLKRVINAFFFLKGGKVIYLNNQWKAAALSIQTSCQDLQMVENYIWFETLVSMSSKSTALRKIWAQWTVQSPANLAVSAPGTLLGASAAAWKVVWLNHLSASTAKWQFHCIAQYGICSQPASKPFGPQVTGS